MNRELKILKESETGYGILIENDAGFISFDKNKDSLTQINESFEFNPDEPILINCILQKYGVPNRNKRIYPEQVLRKQVEAYNEMVNNYSAISEADHPECVLSSESQILTSDGWKYFDDIKDDEIVCTLNTNNNKIEYQQILKRTHQKYSGIMYKIKHLNAECTLTPNHRLLLESSNNKRFYMTIEEIYNSDILKNEKLNLLKLNTNFKIYLNDDSLLIEKINVEDVMVSCVTTPNSNFYLMVNGKSHWTGNSTNISLLNISHLITKMWWGNTPEDKHVLYGTLRLVVSPGFIKYGVPTMIGDKIVVYLQHKIRIGISSRGVGSLVEKNGEFLVQDDFELVGFDLVATPSTYGAYLFPNRNQLQMKENYIKNNIINEKINAIDKFLL